MAATDMTGRRFGKLVVISRHQIANKGPHWLCACDCGETTIAATGHLNAGQRVSCGCQVADSRRKHGLSYSPEYRAWTNARDRCRNPNNRKYSLYGARGIRMCDRWVASFENFIADLGLKPSPNHSLDRWPNGDGNYEPGNCRWATAVQQNNNRSINRHVYIQGKKMTVAEASRFTGIPHATIRDRLDRGLPAEDIIKHG